MPVPLYQAKAEFFRMLGHPVRIRVLELLQDGPKPVRDLLAETGIEPSGSPRSWRSCAGPASSPHPPRQHRRLRTG
jgi:hypothetical protein